MTMMYLYLNIFGRAGFLCDRTRAGANGGLALVLGADCDGPLRDDMVGDQVRRGLERG